MPYPPTLRTARLTLRPFTAADAPQVQTLAGAYEIALNTLSIAHPYPEGAAAAWIATHETEYDENRVHHFAIAIEEDGNDNVAGSMGLMIKGEGIAELGYWVGVPFWGRGYASEAAEAILRYGFEQCGLHRIFACHFTRNPASGKVILKMGMQYEGTMRQHVHKWDEYLDMSFYGILRDEWLARR